MILSAAVDNGQPGYPRLVFLHGFSGDRNEWRKVGDAFPARPRLYLDLPGHGGSADIAVQDLPGSIPCCSLRLIVTTYISIG